MDGIVKTALQNGGRIAPLFADKQFHPGAGFMNPTILADGDRLLVNLRHINYTLYHSERKQFPSWAGPLAYLHPETDLTLRTVNYLCELDNDLNVLYSHEIDTTQHDVPALWEFHGLEDGRLARWDDKLYLIGVRRDTTTNGQGRMELSEILLTETGAQEVSRTRIPAPAPNDSYCEKNWMPILDKPYHFVKWTNPTEVVAADPAGGATITTALNPGISLNWDARGGSQVVKWGNHYIAFVHQVSLWHNYLNQKDGLYRHRLAVWNDQFELVGISPEPMHFIDADIEFVAGACEWNGSLLVTFGYQDNAAYVLDIPGSLVDRLIGDAGAY